jgi:hypothetical protein
VAYKPHTRGQLPFVLHQDITRRTLPDRQRPGRELAWDYPILYTTVDSGQGNGLKYEYSLFFLAFFNGVIEFTIFTTVTTSNCIGGDFIVVFAFATLIFHNLFLTFYENYITFDLVCQPSI